MRCDPVKVKNHIYKHRAKYTFLATVVIFSQMKKRPMPDTNIFWIENYPRF